MSEANISRTCCEVILNSDFSSAKGKKDFLGNVNEDMANQRTLEVDEKRIDTGTNDVGNFENSSFQDASKINDDDWSAEPHHLLIILLPILLVGLCKAQIRKWKKEKRRKGPRNLKRIRSQSTFLGTGKHKRSLLSHNQYGGKSFWKSGWLWITVSCGLFFPSSIPASTAPTSKPKIDVVIHARVNDSLRVSCGGVAQSIFKWMRYYASGERQERLYASGNARNCTNPLMTCLPNGTIIFQSVQVSDTGTYYCIAHNPATETPSTEYSVYLNVQNLTVNHSQVEVEPKSIPDSKRGVKIAGGVFGGLVVFAAVAVLICCLVKRRSRTRVEKHTDTGNGVSIATDAHTTIIPMLNGHQESQLPQ